MPHRLVLVMSRSFLTISNVASRNKIFLHTGKGNKIFPVTGKSGKNIDNIFPHSHKRNKMFPDAKMESPYEGGKEMLLVEDVDNRDFLQALLPAMYEELPAVKKK